jgi:hypothetical protein
VNKVFRWSLTTLVVLMIFIAGSWLFTTIQLERARSRGIYPSAEAGMLANAQKYYSDDREVRILYAGTNTFDGSKPYLWYVIAEIHASARADGSELGHNGCDAPGSYFLQIKDGGWVHVSEGAFPTMIGFWMDVFDMAGVGQSTPSTDWAPDQPAQFCR